MLNLWVLSYVGSTRRFMNLSVRKKIGCCMRAHRRTYPAKKLGAFTNESRVAFENDAN